MREEGSEWEANCSISARIEGKVFLVMLLREVRLPYFPVPKNKYLVEFIIFNTIVFTSLSRKFFLFSHWKNVRFFHMRAHTVTFPDIEKKNTPGTKF
jgi:hypothetical protein